LERPLLNTDTLARLKEHDWPGNVRELKNVLERAMIFHQPKTLEAAHISFDNTSQLIQATKPDLIEDFDHHNHFTASYSIPSASRPAFVNRASGTAMVAENYRPASWSLPEEGINLEGLEKSLLMQALEKTRNNQTKAAALLGISRHTFRYRLEKYGILNQ
jgi:two-component system, NtrC family, response regulator AtoC